MLRPPIETALTYGNDPASELGNPVRAVDIVELALEAHGAPVYVHHEIVHNTYVVEQLRRRGAIAYTPDKGNTVGYHKIHLVVTKQKDLVVQARDGYYSGSRAQ